MPAKIYDMKGFANPARVRVALAEKGRSDAVEFTLLDVFTGKHRLPAFRAKNPTQTAGLSHLTAWRARLAARPSIAHA